MMKLAEILQTQNLPDVDINGISSDSRAVRRGFIFFALSGSKVNGCEYIEDAVNHGAVAVVLANGSAKPTSLKQLAVQWIEVENPRLALAKAAAKFYPVQPETIVAVTGTNGKTSTVNFTRQIWEALGYKAASLGTLGLQGKNISAIDHYGSMTTPDPRVLHSVLNELAEQGINHLAMEASSHGLNQHRLDGVKINAAGFTNITLDHLDYHGTMEAYAEAKIRLFSELLLANGIAVINADAEGSDIFIQAAKNRGIKTWTYGYKGGDFKILSLQPNSTGQNLRLEILGQLISFHLPLVGSFQVMNLLCATGLVLARCQKRVQEVVDILPNIKPVDGRLEFVTGHAQGAGVYVDYAHTPDALEHVLNSLRPHTKGKLICVFGCGGDRDKTKRPIMGSIVSRLADVAIVTDDNPRSENAQTIRAEIMAEALDAIEISDRRKAIAEALAVAQAQDVVLIAGKGHEQGQIIGDHVEPFDDVTEARAAMSLIKRAS